MIAKEEIQGKLELMKAHRVSPIVICFIELLLCSGSRVSALLNLSYNDILSDGTIIIRQGKGSAAMRSHSPSYREYLTDCLRCQFDPFRCLNYMQIYRVMKRYNLVMPNSFGTLDAVTAIGRKNVAQEMQMRGEDLQTIADILGHRSINSTLFYLQDGSNKIVAKGGILAKPFGKHEEIVFCKNGVIKVVQKKDK